MLHNLGFAKTPEPFQKLIHQGMILGSDGEKMSKSRGNVVNPGPFSVLILYDAMNEHAAALPH